MKAAVHLGPNYTKHVEMYKKAKFEEIQNLFDIIQKLMWDHHGEILNVKHIGSTGPSWTRSTLSHDQVIKWAKAKVLVYSDSVLLLEKCHCSWTKSRAREEVILKAQKDTKKVHFASLMDICHLEHAELEPTFQKYKGPVVLRGDLVKDDFGAFAVCIAQGSSASQMTAAKIDGWHCKTTRL